jgi:hypothetical protein
MVIADERQRQGKSKGEGEKDRRNEHDIEKCAGSSPGHKKKRPNLFRFGLSVTQSSSSHTITCVPKFARDNHIEAKRGRENRDPKVPGTGTLHNSHTCTGCLKWRYRDESAQFEMNWAFFSFGLGTQILFQRQNCYDLVTRLLRLIECDTVCLQNGYSARVGKSYTLMIESLSCDLLLLRVHSRSLFE